MNTIEAGPTGNKNRQLNQIQFTKPQIMKVDQTEVLPANRLPSEAERGAKHRADA